MCLRLRQFFICTARGRYIIITEGGDLRLPPPEHSKIVYCYQYHYEPVSSGGEASRVMGVQSVVEIGRLGLGRDADYGLGGGTDGGGGVDGRDGDEDGLTRWEDNA